MGTAEGQAAAGDIPNFASGGATLMIVEALDPDGVPGGLELDQRLEAGERVALGRGAGDALDGLGGELVDRRGVLRLAGGVDDRVDVAVAAQGA